MRAAQVSALYELGPNYQSTFLPMEFDAGLEQAPAAHALLIDSRDGLGPKLAMSYNAQVACQALSHLTDNPAEGSDGRMAGFWGAASMVCPGRVCVSHAVPEHEHVMFLLGCQGHKDLSVLD